MVILLFIAGLVCLIVGAEALVRGASRLAAALGVSPLVIGLTVVAFGTSAPEFAVSIKAALGGQSDITVGNVIGSNVFNVLAILGLSALIAPLTVARKLVRLEVPLLIGASLLALALGLDGGFGRIDGFVLFAALIAYLGFLLYQGKEESAGVRDANATEFGASGQAASGWLVNLALIIGGLAMLVLGSRWLVDSAVAMARYLGVSELVIALTVVAAGTSLPEVVTSAIAAARGETDIAVGNVVGSSLFNILGVLGLASLLAPGGIGITDAVIGFDLPIMIVIAFACLPVFFTGGRISRGEGALFLGYYVAYTLYLILAAAEHDALPRFSAVMLYFALPLTLVTLVVVALHELRTLRRGG